METLSGILPSSYQKMGHEQQFLSRLMSGQVIQDWEPLDHLLGDQLIIQCNYTFVKRYPTSNQIISICMVGSLAV
jgi:hypothetical protein